VFFGDQGNAGDQSSSWPRYLANFVSRVETAAALLSLEHDRPVVLDKTAASFAFVALGWRGEILKSVFTHLSEIMAVLRDAEFSEAQSELIDFEAFDALAGLTPAHRELLLLRQQDTPEALRALVTQLEITREQVAATVALVSKVEPIAAPAEVSDDALRKLLDRAGGTLGLTEASKQLGITRQALHKRVYNGNALGMMHDNRIVLPKLQFVTEGKETTILSGIDRIAKVFQESKAGPFSALQFLIDADPNLEARPIDVLKKGNADAAYQAARAYLSMDEA
jgi:hypothetical protein